MIASIRSSSLIDRHKDCPAEVGGGTFPAHGPGSWIPPRWNSALPAVTSGSWASGSFASSKSSPNSQLLRLLVLNADMMGLNWKTMTLRTLIEHMLHLLHHAVTVVAEHCSNLDKITVTNITRTDGTDRAPTSSLSGNHQPAPSTFYTCEMLTKEAYAVELTYLSSWILNCVDLNANLNLREV
jgi:hypothetical protein